MKEGGRVSKEMSEIGGLPSIVKGGKEAIEKLADGKQFKSKSTFKKKSRLEKQKNNIFFGFLCYIGLTFFGVFGFVLDKQYNGPSNSREGLSFCIAVAYLIIGLIATLATVYVCGKFQKCLKMIKKVNKEIAEEQRK